MVPLDQDRVLVSFRNISTVCIIEKSTGELKWKLGYDVLSQQHDPNELSNGNILVFDNGGHRSNVALSFSRVIEIDPKTKEIAWEYRDTPPYNFFSPYISGARRLTNGNTHITEGQFGRMFQVTKGGAVVWEYINPYFDPGPDGWLVNSGRPTISQRRFLRSGKTPTGVRSRKFASSPCPGSRCYRYGRLRLSG